MIKLRSFVVRAQRHFPARLGVLPSQWQAWLGNHAVQTLLQIALDSEACEGRLASHITQLCPVL